MGSYQQGALVSLRRVQPAGLVLLAGVSLLAVVNVAQFSTVEGRGSVFFSAVHHRENADILAEMRDEDASSSSRYALFLALEDVAPGSVILIAEDDSGGEEWFAGRLYAFGGVQDVERVEGNALDLLGGVDPTPFIVADGPGGPRGEPWAIAMESGDVVTDPSGSFSGEASAHPDSIEVRTFLAVRWPADTEEGYRRLLIDVGLLSEEGV
ncbi:MAG: hypothetical protein JW722_07045 [Demequinaceae bacterium]|nr:hypothetical protein [Demequinaceae bacterium]